MTRPVDAYTVIDMIDEWLDSVGTVMEGKGLSSYGELIGCIEDTPTLTQPNEWVSVKDDTPDQGERVLATDGVFVGEGYINCYGKWRRPNGMLWSVFKTEVSHWMPIPAPLKEDNQ